MGFDFREEWKERLVYREDSKEFTFVCGWGVTPGIVYVPTAGAWNLVTPEWMHNRRDEILNRLRANIGSRYLIHEFEEDRSARAKGWVTVFGATRDDGYAAGEWIAALMRPDETATPDASWPQEDRTRFLADHLIGSGDTPDEAVEDLKRRTGRPDLRWGV